MARLPPETVAVLETVGKWLDTNGKAIYGTERGQADGNVNANYTRRGNTLYIHQHYWPGHTPAAEWLELSISPSGRCHRRPQAQGAVGAAAEDRPESRVHAGRVHSPAHRVCRWLRPTSRPRSSKWSATASQSSITRDASAVAALQRRNQHWSTSTRVSLI
jgi:hypothetical protein